jgi:hypothetical protein
MQSDLPSPEELLRVADQEGTRGLIVYGSHNWRDDPDQVASVTAKPGPDRDLVILSRGVIVRCSSLPRLERWLSRHPDLVRRCRTGIGQASNKPSGMSSQTSALSITSQQAGIMEENIEGPSRYAPRQSALAIAGLRAATTAQ